MSFAMTVFDWEEKGKEKHSESISEVKVLTKGLNIDTYGNSCFESIKFCFLLISSSLTGFFICSYSGPSSPTHVCARLEGYVITGIMETWWDDSYDWGGGKEGYRLFSKDGPGRRGRVVAV